jgi:excisionase family DNA binding protein
MGMTTKKAAEYLGCTPAFVISLIHREKLKAYKHGPVWVIDPDSVEDYKNAPKDKGGRPPKKNKGS